MRRSVLAATAAVAVLAGTNVIGVGILDGDQDGTGVSDCSAPPIEGYQPAEAVERADLAVDVEWLASMEGAIAMDTREDDPVLYAASILGTVSSVGEAGEVEVLVDLAEEVNVGENESGLLDLAISPDGTRL